jgi:hypothetical protein
MWKKCGRLDVSAGSLGPTLAGSQPLHTFKHYPCFCLRNSSFSPLLMTSLELPGSRSKIKPCHGDDILAKDLTERVCVCVSQPKYHYLEQFSEEDVDYFRRMPFSLSIPSHGVLVVHAGIVPGTPLEDQLLDDLINVSTLPLSECTTTLMPHAATQSTVAERACFLEADFLLTQATSPIALPLFC